MTTTFTREYMDYFLLEIDKYSAVGGLMDSNGDLIGGDGLQ